MEYFGMDFGYKGSKAKSSVGPFENKLERMIIPEAYVSSIPEDNKILVENLLRQSTLDYKMAIKTSIYRPRVSKPHSKSRARASVGYF